MTRRQALGEAIKIINKYNIKEERKREIVAKLELCAAELPFAAWSEAAVLDACADYIQTHGRLIIKNFRPPALPSPSTVASIFKMPVRVFRDYYFPLPLSAGGNSPYRHQPPQTWRARFIADFSRIQPTSGADYNAQRAPGLPAWSTLARRLDCTTWRALLADCGLSVGAQTHYTVRHTGAPWSE